MTHYLAQALKLPWDGGTTTLQYPDTMKIFASRFSTIGDFISSAIPLVFAFAGIGLLLMILGAGFGMLTSAGDPKKLEGARGRLTNAMVGFLIIFVSYWLVQLVGKMFGITEFGTIFQ